jgi:DNA repair protein RadA/Sms
MKTKSSFVCQECGYESSSWLGKCPECGQWNGFKEFKVQSEKSKSGLNVHTETKVDLAPKTFSEIVSTQTSRLKTGFSEMDGVLGGGIVKGSVTLIAGDPGIGKSTLLLQTCINIAQTGKRVLYISGEESVEQIKMRAERIVDANTLQDLLLLSISQVDAFGEIIEKAKPELVIIDSIQTMESEEAGGLSGSVGQIRYATQVFVRIAKTKHIPFILVGHVTKEGMVAGPMMLSHMVDTVLFLEGEKFTTTRLLRSLKNRFGPIDEVGVFLMEKKGMAEVKNPEQVFLSKKKEETPGSVLVVVMEGTRSFLIEIQALVVYSKFPMPRRVVSGVDARRVELLLAVLQKHCRLPVETMDVFVNIAGGMRVDDPGADLGICLAVYSSLKNKPLSQIVGIGEVGLLGELRMVTGLEKRIKEATKLGFTSILTPKKFSSLPQVLASLG